MECGARRRHKEKTPSSRTFVENRMQEGLLRSSSVVRSRIEQRREQVGGGDDALLVVFRELDGGLKGPSCCLGQLRGIHVGVLTLDKGACWCVCREKGRERQGAKPEARDLVDVGDDGTPSVSAAPDIETCRHIHVKVRG